MYFEMAKCSYCHSGDYYTDMKRHDVGSGLEEYKGFEFDTPTLREVWRTAPYLYDGRARTVFEMLRKFNKDDKHGHTSDLTDQELKELEEFVLSENHIKIFWLAPFHLSVFTPRRIFIRILSAKQLKAQSYP